ncbi:MAG: DUF1294 domain-containing protein [Clostridiales bacterium]|nr:DUF1294 domain-containing protein [Clostridiales bacterium]
MIILKFYLLLMSIIGFLLMGMDKLFAKKDMYRIPERTLILFAILGAAIGSFMGMLLFRHKTRKAKFFITLPLFAVVYAALSVYLFVI